MLLVADGMGMSEDVEFHKGEGRKVNVYIRLRVLRFDDGSS